jgi:hypothetical protein
MKCVLRGSLRSHLRMRTVVLGIGGDREWSGLHLPAAVHPSTLLILRCERSEPRRTHFPCAS